MAAGRTSSRLVPLSEKLLSRLSADTPTPEDLLLEKEEREGPTPIEGSPPGRRRQMVRVRAALQQIPTLEADCVALSMSGVSLEEVAEQLGVASETARTGVARGVWRLRWILGPGALFTPVDVVEEFVDRMGAPDVQILAVLWETTSIDETGRRVGASHQDVGRRFTALLAELRMEARSTSSVRPYAKGFTELRAWGMRALWDRRANRYGLRTEVGTAGASQLRVVPASVGAPARPATPGGPGLVKATPRVPEAADSWVPGWR